VELKCIGYTTVHASFLFFGFVLIDISCGQWCIALLQQFILSHFDGLLPHLTYVLHVDRARPVCSHLADARRGVARYQNVFPGGREARKSLNLSAMSIERVREKETRGANIKETK
jgi:hypothetical protein